MTDHARSRAAGFYSQYSQRASARPLRERGDDAPRIASLPAASWDAAPVQLQGTLDPAILHVRIADFAAVVAVRDRPELATRPHIVCDDPSGRGLVLAASPEARAQGVATGMALRIAEKLCPRATVTTLDPERLLAAADAVLDLLGGYTPLVEPAWLVPARGRRATPVPAVARLARCFGALLDVRGCERLFGPAASIGYQLGAALTERGYSALVGIGTSPSLAAVASALATPGAPLLVPVGEERAFLDRVPLGGQGQEPPLLDLDPDLLAHLDALGVRQIGQLARLPAAALRRRFGVAGAAAHAQARGAAQRPLAPPPTPDLLEAACALDEPVADLQTLQRALSAPATRLAAQLGERAQAAGHLTLTITEARGAYTRAAYLKEPVASAHAIHLRACALLAQLLAPAGACAAPIHEARLQAAVFVPAAVQLALPLPPGDARRQTTLDDLVERLRRRFGPQAARRAHVVEHALLPEERVRWDTPAPPSKQPSLAVRLGPDGRPAAVRRGCGVWEPVQAICSQWRLRTRWWMDPTHRHYYLVETARGAVLELYQELSDGSWHLACRKD